MDYVGIDLHTKESQIGLLTEAGGVMGNAAEPKRSKACFLTPSPIPPSAQRADSQGGQTLARGRPARPGPARPGSIPAGVSPLRAR